MTMMNLEVASRHLGESSPSICYIIHISYIFVTYLFESFVLLPTCFSVMLLNISLTKFLSSFLARCGLGHVD